MEQVMAQKKKFFLVSTKAKGLRFEIIKLNKDEMKATIVGDTGVPFDTSIDQKYLDELGYVVEITMVEVADAPVHSEQATA
jgi:hypothetical protein